MLNQTIEDIIVEINIERNKSKDSPQRDYKSADLDSSVKKYNN